MIMQSLLTIELRHVIHIKPMKALSGCAKGLRNIKRVNNIVTKQSTFRVIFRQELVLDGLALALNQNIKLTPMLGQERDYRVSLPVR